MMTDHAPSCDDYLARARWCRMCMFLLMMQDDMRIAAMAEASARYKRKNW